MPLEVEVLFDRIPGLIIGMRQRVARTVDAAADEIVEEAKAELAAGHKTGATYTHGGASHQASAPGEAPANESMALSESIQAVGEAPFEKRIEVGTDHALPLEFGRADGHIAARPFMAPAAERVRPKFIGYVAKAIVETEL